MIEIQFKNSIDLYPNSDWVEGRFYNRGRNYRFQAKVNAKNSEVYGICGGRFIKFWVQNTDNGKVVLDYDRGYGVGNESIVSKGYIKELMNLILSHIKDIDSQYR